MDQDQEYLDLILKAVQVCATYRPMFGQGRKGGLTLDEFRHLYGADPFYSWFGLDSPLIYAAHRVSGGMTSLYRQIGIGCQWLLNRILRDYLGLSVEDANWSYSIPKSDGKEQRLTLDARIAFDTVTPTRQPTVDGWLSAAASALSITREAIHNGAVFEIRQGYKSKDSKRQNADIANASNAYAYQYLPVVALLSNQIDSDVAVRYQRARWLILRGTPSGTTLDSTYIFYREIVGYDVADFFTRTSPILTGKVRLRASWRSSLEQNSTPLALFPEALPPARALTRRDHLTFKGNRDRGRHGWLRLTPAYSVHMIEEFVGGLGTHDIVLDPFCGTGTTALVCAQAGVRCHTVDINPFLLWLSNAKCAKYTQQDVICAESTLQHALTTLDSSGRDIWIPPIHDVGKWWEPHTLQLIGHIFDVIQHAEMTSAARDLLLIIFCRAAISLASVSFGHQSMSFKKSARESRLIDVAPRDAVYMAFSQAARDIGRDAAQPPCASSSLAILGDSRSLPDVLPHADYTTVITSPPYPNRMSYIRELRPYMYWLGYLETGRQAGELDWRAIGGTWGCATSNLLTWSPPDPQPIPSDAYHAAVEQITSRSKVLGRYVAKYFCDVVLHVQSLRAVLVPGAKLHYIVGNSKFYDVMLHTERIYAAIFADQGFQNITIEAVRKRTSKKELFEYVVSARA